MAYEVWPKEAAEWKGSEWARLQDLKIVVLHGAKKEFRLEQDADLYVINFEGLAWLCAENYKRFNAARFDTLVIDESSKMKHTNTQRFKLLKPVMPTFKRRWILTGSPNPNGYLDLFGQIYIIDLGRALGAYITHFRFDYFYPSGYGGYTWLLKPGADAAITKKLQPYVLRMDAADYLKLPELVENVKRVELPDKARKVYDDMESEMFAELEGDREVTAASAGAAGVKCSQIANGGLYHNPEDETEEDLIKGRRSWTNLHEAKLDAVEEILEELQGSPAFVAYEYDHDLARLRERFGKDIPTLSGKISPGLVEKWNASEIPLLLGQFSAISHGLNLQYGACRHVIWHSLTYDFEIFDQLIKRFRRQGSIHSSIFNHVILARATVDEAKWRALKAKNRTQQGFLNALREYAKLRK